MAPHWPIAPAEVDDTPAASGIRFPVCTQIGSSCSGTCTKGDGSTDHTLIAFAAPETANQMLPSVLFIPDNKQSNTFELTVLDFDDGLCEWQLPPRQPNPTPTSPSAHPASIVSLP